MAARSKRARKAAARKGWQTRRARLEQRQREHGKIARERTEARLTPAQKAARTRAANQLEREIRFERRSRAAKRGWDTRRANAKRAPSKPASARRRRQSGGAMGTDANTGGFTAGPVGAFYSLDQLDDYDDDNEVFDVETSPDYA